VLARDHSKKKKKGDDDDDDDDDDDNDDDDDGDDDDDDEDDDDDTGINTPSLVPHGIPNFLRSNSFNRNRLSCEWVNGRLSPLMPSLSLL